MSWNKSFIVIIDAGEPDHEGFFTDLGLEVVGEVDFRSVSNKNFATVAVGSIDNHLYITYPGRVEALFQEHPGQLEEWLIGKYPTNRICALQEDGTGNSFGFCLIEAGQRKRVLLGVDNYFRTMEGDDLPLEEVLKQQLISELSGEERKEIAAGGKYALEDYIEFESRWRLPFAWLHREHAQSMDELYERNPTFKKYKRIGRAGR